MASTIAFTYDLGTALGKARFYAGDTDGTGLTKTGGDRTRTDAEVAFLLVQEGNDPRRAAAALLENKAADYAQAAVKTEQGQLRQDFTQRSTQCLVLAKTLRGQSGSLASSGASGMNEPLFSMDDMEGW